MNRSGKQLKGRPRGKPWPPGVSGNPAGRPQGALNKLSLAVKGRPLAVNARRESINPHTMTEFKGRTFLYHQDCPEGRIFTDAGEFSKALKGGWVEAPWLAWCNLGIAYAQSGNRSAALEAIKELRRYDPHTADKLFNLIMKP